MKHKPLKNLLIFGLLSGMFLVTSCVGNPTNESLTSDAAESQNSASESAYFHFDYFLNDGEKLPKSEENGCTPVWQITSGNAVIENDIIRKTPQAAEYEQIVLSSTCGTERKETNHILLDPYVGYVISYFSETGEEKETLKLAYTYNNLYWFKLNHDHSILTPSTGTGRLRDPSILRKKDGSFALLATEGYDNPSVYLYDSKDLILYENERLCKLNTLSGKQAWAPEGFYDRASDQYVIYWSSVEDQGMFYNTSPDLISFSPPVRLLDPGFTVIDGTFIFENNQTAVILKDEREPMEEYSQLLIGYGENWFSIDTFSEPFSGHQSEGPMVLKCFEKEGYDIFYDDYTRYQFKAYHTDQLIPFSPEPIQDSELMIPLEEPAHSYAVAVTWKELSRLLERYGE